MISFYQGNMNGQVTDETPYVLSETANLSGNYLIGTYRRKVNGKFLTLSFYARSRMDGGKPYETFAICPKDSVHFNFSTPRLNRDSIEAKIAQAVQK